MKAREVVADSITPSEAPWNQARSLPTLARPSQMEGSPLLSPLQAEWLAAPSFLFACSSSPRNNDKEASACPMLF